MCGIVGTLIFDESNRTINPALLSAMRDAMVHRGPDGAGLWLSPDSRVGFGHRRLSIVDLSVTANQPMCNEDGTLWVTFNGEIYNHAEIRRELNARGGHVWKTHHSDTEVILHAFETWGIEAVHRFRGMFAFALWDSKQRELWLVRDRLGIKPLYFSRHHGRVSFASEIKALIVDPEQPRRVNEEALFHYLSFLTSPAPMTLFEGIEKLPAATWMRIRPSGDVVTSQYWDPLAAAQQVTPETSEAAWSERILAELRESVQLHKESDVPVGVFLSGGIDSSTNAALFAERSDHPLRTYTIGYQGDYTSYENEIDIARSMADRVGAQHHERLLHVDDLIDFLPKMITLQDEPIADPVCVPVYYVSEMARNSGVRVCQVGEGADELFCGYPRWKTLLRLQQWNDVGIPRSMKQLGLWGLQLAGQKSKRPYEALRRACMQQPIFWSGAEAFTQSQKLRLLSPRLASQFRRHTSWDVLKPIHQRFLQTAREPSPLNWMSYVDLNLRLPELLLMRVDKMAMGVSLEGRVPFLDHRVVEMSMAIPSSLKLKQGRLKHLLKEAVRGVIPDSIIDRKKQGFGVPIHEWFMDRLGDRAERELHSFCRNTDYLNSATVEKLLARRSAKSLWYLMNFALWHRAYIQGDRSLLSMPSSRPMLLSA